MCKVCEKELADSGGISNFQNRLRMKHVEKAKKAFEQEIGSYLIKPILCE